MRPLRRDIEFSRRRDDHRGMPLRTSSVVARSALAALALGGACGGDSGDDVTMDAAAVTGEPAALAGITAAHNQVRAQVDTRGTSGPLPALTWDDALAATAAAWASQCKDGDGDGLIDHNPGRSDGHAYYVGENIFASSGMATGAGAVMAWANEGPKYHYDSNTCDSGAVCGHYTQLVWRATLQVGCAIASCPKLKYPSVVVCDYGPGGNVNNQKPY
jgi:hypothetical protein